MGRSVGPCATTYAQGLRIVGFERRVTVAFAVGEDIVTILRVFYGGRDWESTFG